MAGKVTEQLGDILGGAGGMASGAADAAKSQATDMMKKATESSGGAGEALKGLFGGAKK